MIVVSGRFRLPLERIADARPYMAKVIAASSAEPGCRVYSYAEAIDEPACFVCTRNGTARRRLILRTALPETFTCC